MYDEQLERAIALSKKHLESDHATSSSYDEQLARAIALSKNHVKKDAQARPASRRRRKNPDFLGASVGNQLRIEQQIAQEKRDTRMRRQSSYEIEDVHDKTSRQEKEAMSILVCRLAIYLVQTTRVLTVEF